jgi:hypothetical protein
MFGTMQVPAALGRRRRAGHNGRRFAERRRAADTLVIISAAFSLVVAGWLQRPYALAPEGSVQ